MCGGFKQRGKRTYVREYSLCKGKERKMGRERGERGGRATKTKTV